jgi:hypothetical protein
MTVYQTSLIKRRRATKAEMAERKDALFNIVAELNPMTVRQVFYQATVSGTVAKTEAGYGMVQRALAEMRRSGTLRWDWIADNTRWQRKPNTHQSPAKAIESVARTYRRDLWADADVYVEIWLEKDALAGVVMDVTGTYDVPLMVSRGYASLSFLYEAATSIAAIGKPTFIYHLGDFDPSGQDAADKIEATLREYACGIDLHFERLAVLPEQIDLWSLPTRPTKLSDTRSRGFGDISVELDAINPHRLRSLVRDAIEKHLPKERLHVLQVAEASERELLTRWAEAVGAEA